MNKLVLGTYEINVGLINQERSNLLEAAINSGIRYLDTSITYNNDIDISEWKGGIISKIDPHMYNQYEYESLITCHLEFLKRDYIDIMLIHNPRDNWHNLARDLHADNRFLHVGVSNFDVNQLEEYKEVVGVYPEYNEIEINPKYVDIDTIIFCNKNNIKIIAYAIFGGKYNAVRNISQYSLPYLLSFAGKYADLVIVRPDNISQLHQIVYANSIEFLNIHPASITKEKSIVPTEYKIPLSFMKIIESTWWPTYNRFDGERLFDSNQCLTKDDRNNDPKLNKLLSIIESLKLEFITDYQVVLRYVLFESGYRIRFFGDHMVICNGHSYYMVGVYLVEDNKLTKVKTENTKIMTKAIMLDSDYWDKTF